MILFKNKILTIFASCSICLSVGSCGSFFKHDTGYSIKDYQVINDENGNTVVTISFTDDSISPLTFSVPSGVGIKNVESNLTSDSILQIKILYTDESLEPTIISVPISNGKDGTGIEDIKCEYNDENDLELTIYLSDGTSKGPFIINKGSDGKSITDITTEFNADLGVTNVTVEYSDGSTTIFPIDLGEDGRGIASVNFSSADDNNYYLNVVYTDGSSEKVLLEKPEVPNATKWYYGFGLPNNNQGVNGDFYLDASNFAIYHKNDTVWSFLFSFKQEQNVEKHLIKFYVNGGEWRFVDQTQPVQEFRQFSVDDGDTFNPSIEMLEVVRDGFAFNGWRTDEIIDVNSGHFTSLTNIFSDLVLYANWVEI